MLSASPLELAVAWGVVGCFTGVLVYWAVAAGRAMSKHDRTRDRAAGNRGKRWTEEEIDDPDACWRDE